MGLASGYLIAMGVGFVIGGLSSKAQGQPFMKGAMRGGAVGGIGAGIGSLASNIYTGTGWSATGPTSSSPWSAYQAGGATGITGATSTYTGMGYIDPSTGKTMLEVSNPTSGTFGTPTSSYVEAPAGSGVPYGGGGSSTMSDYGALTSAASGPTTGGAAGVLNTIKDFAKTATGERLIGSAIGLGIHALQGQPEIPEIPEMPEFPDFGPPPTTTAVPLQTTETGTYSSIAPEILDPVSIPLNQARKETLTPAEIDALNTQRAEQESALQTIAARDTAVGIQGTDTYADSITALMRKRGERIPGIPIYT